MQLFQQHLILQLRRRRLLQLNLPIKLSILSLLMRILRLRLPSFHRLFPMQLKRNLQIPPKLFLRLIFNFSLNLKLHKIKLIPRKLLNNKLLMWKRPLIKLCTRPIKALNSFLRLRFITKPMHIQQVLF